MNQNLFGDVNRYYSKSRLPERKSGEQWDTPLEKQIRNLLTTKQSDAKKRVAQACKQANIMIREYLRAETALKLSQADRRQSVPYQVVDGIPKSLAIKLENLPDPILLLLMQNKQLLKNGEAALDFVLECYPEIRKVLSQQSDIKDDLMSSKDFFSGIHNMIDSFRLPDVIREIEEDVLGAYYFYVPAIQIYWMPIGLIAGILDNVSIEDLTFVVLAHELSHAYTHMGLDIDGVQWNTDKFACTDKMIVEGLAQFYTESICNKYANRQPGILNSFNKLLEKQPEPYKHFRKWEKQHASEIVRFSMIAARSKNIQDYNQFLETMKDIEAKIPSRNEKQKDLLGR